ncbi:hypothetical protein K458DRAFT_51788 [Lentithecium fluviatile CBS 122367]|uniref:Uncharacterized protein n=1 Tax=Lentithecium fluviatile CBS 122367 TaxID=1168545 RepID=A0A6G1IY78_9PLEO|nr:hypothetical protein K458DRAFT_51788 [Lentithecium fluviatile CBS 122367]
MLVRDAAVTRRASAYPNFKKLCLQIAVLITGTCIHPTLTPCPNLTGLSITGHERRLSCLHLPNLSPLATYATIAANVPNLRRLDLRRAIPAGADFYDPLAAITKPQSRNLAEIRRRG